MDVLLSLAQQVVPFVVLLTTLVFVHELGHYAVARYYGVRVEVFSIGIGPELCGWTDAHRTRWKICFFPIGGYVRFLGDADASSRPNFEALEHLSSQERASAFMAKPPTQRIAIACAGPAANYLLALLLFWGMYAFVGQKYTDPVVGGFTEDSPAYAAGIRQGDRIVALDDHPVERFEDILISLRQRHAPEALRVSIDRPSQGELSFVVMPRIQETKDIFGDVHRFLFLGISSGTTHYKSLNLFQAGQKACGDLVALSVGNLKGLWEILIGVRPKDEMGGPIRIAQMSSKIFDLHHLTPFIWFLGTLSVTLGLINLFPIPMLDGGHVVLYTIEKLKGSPLSERVQEYAFRIGFAIVGSLMVLAMWNDLQKLTIVQALKQWVMS